jgi:hypothetical protein
VDGCKEFILGRLVNFVNFGNLCNKCGEIFGPPAELLRQEIHLGEVLASVGIIAEGRVKFLGEDGLMGEQRARWIGSLFE